MSTTITQRVTENLRKRGIVVLDREDWGSRHGAVYETRRRIKPARQPADTVVQHITVTVDHGPLTGDFKADVRTVEQIGMDRFGSGVSYNWVVDMQTGMVAVGQPLDAKGTHTVNDKGVAGFSHDQNLVARAIAVLGMPESKLSAKAEHAISCLIAAMIDEGAVTRGHDYVPHSLFAWKDCPCDATRDRMAAIRRAAIRQLDGGDRPTSALLKVAHASLEVFDTPTQIGSDLERIFTRAQLRDWSWITGTEAGPDWVRRLVREAARDHGFRVWQPERATDAWIAVRRDEIAGDLKGFYQPVIPSSKSLGSSRPFGPKGVVAVAYDHVDDAIGRVGVAAAHYLTGGARPGPLSVHGGVDHYEWNRKLAAAIGEWAKEAGAGGALAFYGGDQNIRDDRLDTFLGAPLTSVQDELGRHENTGHGPIDVIASYDRDKRVKARRVDVQSDREFALHGDHFLVEAVFEVQALR